MQQKLLRRTTFLFAIIRTYDNMANCFEKKNGYTNILGLNLANPESHKHGAAPIATDTTGIQRDSSGTCSSGATFSHTARGGPRGRTHTAPKAPHTALAMATLVAPRRHAGTVPGSPLGPHGWKLRNSLSELEAPCPSPSAEGGGGSQPARAAGPIAAIALGGVQQAQAGPRPPPQPPPPSPAGRAPVVTGLRPKLLWDNFIKIII